MPPLTFLNLDVAVSALQEASRELQAKQLLKVLLVIQIDFLSESWHTQYWQEAFGECIGIIAKDAGDIQTKPAYFKAVDCVQLLWDAGAYVDDSTKRALRKMNKDAWKISQKKRSNPNESKVPKTPGAMVQKQLRSFHKESSAQNPIKTSLDDLPIEILQKICAFTLALSDSSEQTDQTTERYHRSKPTQSQAWLAFSFCLVSKSCSRVDSLMLLSTPNVRSDRVEAFANLLRKIRTPRVFVSIDFFRATNKDAEEGKGREMREDVALAARHANTKALLNVFKNLANSRHRVQTFTFDSRVWSYGIAPSLKRIGLDMASLTLHIDVLRLFNVDGNHLAAFVPRCCPLQELDLSTRVKTDKMGSPARGRQLDVRSLSIDLREGRFSDSRSYDKYCASLLKPHVSYVEIIRWRFDAWPDPEEVDSPHFLDVLEQASYLTDLRLTHMALGPGIVHGFFDSLPYGLQVLVLDRPMGPDLNMLGQLLVSDGRLRRLKELTLIIEAADCFADLIEDDGEFSENERDIVKAFCSVVDSAMYERGVKTAIDFIWDNENLSSDEDMAGFTEGESNSEDGLYIDSSSGTDSSSEGY